MLHHERDNKRRGGNRSRFPERTRLAEGPFFGSENKSKDKESEDEDDEEEDDEECVTQINLCTTVIVGNPVTLTRNKGPLPNSLPSVTLRIRGPPNQPRNPHSRHS